MLSEDKIMEKLESRYRMYIKTDREKYLYQAEILVDVLELDIKTDEEIFKRISEEMGREGNYGKKI